MTLILILPKFLEKEFVEDAEAVIIDADKLQP